MIEYTYSQELGLNEITEASGIPYWSPAFDDLPAVQSQRRSVACSQAMDNSAFRHSNKKLKRERGLLEIDLAIQRAEKRRSFRERFKL